MKYLSILSLVVYGHSQEKVIICNNDLNNEYEYEYMNMNMNNEYE